MSKVLVITGASKGIGKQTVNYFLENGWQVINLSRTLCELGDVQNFSVDLSNKKWRDEYGAILCSIAKEAEQICLVHNAACYYKDNVENLPDEQMREVLEVNVIAPTMLNQLFLPFMKPGSSILYIGSTLSEKGTHDAASYIISKHALAGLMKATVQDLAGKNIHSCCICPGFTDTEMLQSHLKQDPQVISAITSRVAIHRLIDPKEIADVVYFCANHPVLNGEVVHINGGQLD